MNRDSAQYINTVNTIAPIDERPDKATFAIVDLAHETDLLRSIYDAMEREAIEWWSFFSGTPWQSQWADGPILVDLRQAEQFTVNMIDQLSTLPAGVLIDTNAAPETVLEHGRQWLFDSLEKETQLFRFYEPRTLAALLCVLDDDPRHDLLSIGRSWVWHDTHQWRRAEAGSDDLQSSGSDPFRVTTTHLDATLPFRLACEAQGLAKHYQASLQGMEKPEEWVLSRLMEGREHGYVRNAHLERWLRLAIQAGAGFHTQAPYQTRLDDTALSPAERLNTMEGQLEQRNA